MGILDNLENYIEFSDGKPKNTESAWDEEFSFESKPIVPINHKGDPITWENSDQSTSPN